VNFLRFRAMTCISRVNCAEMAGDRPKQPDFEHGLYACARPVAIAIGHQYQIRKIGPGEHSLLIIGVTNMTGLYTCTNRDTQTAIDSVMINTICKYIILLSLIISPPKSDSLRSGLMF